MRGSAIYALELGEDPENVSGRLFEIRHKGQWYQLGDWLLVVRRPRALLFRHENEDFCEEWRKSSDWRDRISLIWMFTNPALFVRSYLSGDDVRTATLERILRNDRLTVLRNFPTVSCLAEGARLSLSRGEGDRLYLNKELLRS